MLFFALVAVIFFSQAEPLAHIVRSIWLKLSEFEPVSQDENSFKEFLLALTTNLFNRAILVEGLTATFA